MQLFGKKDNLEAGRPDVGLRQPEPIKYDVKLTGFGTAVKLNSQGCALQPSPYRSASVLLEFCTLHARCYEFIDMLKLC